MNHRAAASIKAIEEALPFEPPDELLLFIIFGSQVRNTQTAESDLDILCVTRTGSRQFYESLHKTMANARDGVRSATVFEHTPQTLEKYANLYGMVEYSALRGHHSGESIILYRSDDACDALDHILPAGVGGCPGDEDGHNNPDTNDTALWARRWLIRSEKAIADGLSYAKKHVSGDDGDGDYAWAVCDTMYESIDSAMKACLLHHGKLFPFTRDIRELHDMLPKKTRIHFDLGALEHWGARSGKRAGQTTDKHPAHCDYTRNDADAAIEAAQRVHAIVSKLLPPHPAAAALQNRAASPLPTILTMPTAAVAPRT